jgi:hypothetical protein
MNPILYITASRAEEIMFGYINDWYTERANAGSAHLRDHYDVHIDFVRNLPLQTGKCEFFVDEKEEQKYMTLFSSLENVIESDGFEKGAKRIHAICDELDSLKVKSSEGDVYSLSIAINRIFSIERYEIQFAPMHMYNALCELCNAVMNILTVTDDTLKKMLANLFDRYIINLAIVGKERILADHDTDEKACNYRLPWPKFVVQSISSSDFDLKTFLTSSPITMFFGHPSAISSELIIVMRDLRSIAQSEYFVCVRTFWWREWRNMDEGTRRVLRKIHGFPRGVDKQRRIIKDRYPKEGAICLTHLFIREI